MTKSISNKLNDIKNKINFLSLLETEYRYRLNKPIDELELKALEQQYDVSLPEGYRAFLLELGDGDENNDCGMLTLRQSLLTLCKIEGVEGRAITISKDSTATYWLVIEGAEKGNMWSVDYDKNERQSPDAFPSKSVQLASDTESSGGRLDFLDWYDDWLEYALSRLVKNAERNDLPPP